MSTKMRSSNPEKILFNHGRVLFIQCLALVCLAPNLLAMDSPDCDDSKNIFSDVSEVSVGDVVKPRSEKEFAIIDGDLGRLSTLLNQRNSPSNIEPTASNTEPTAPNQDKGVVSPRNKKTLIHNPFKRRNTDKGGSSSPMVSPTDNSKKEKMAKEKSFDGRDQVNNYSSSKIATLEPKDSTVQHTNEPNNIIEKSSILDEEIDLNNLSDGEVDEMRRLWREIAMKSVSEPCRDPVKKVIEMDRLWRMELKMRKSAEKTPKVSESEIKPEVSESNDGSESSKESNIDASENN